MSSARTLFDVLYSRARYRFRMIRLGLTLTPIAGASDAGTADADTDADADTSDDADDKAADTDADKADDDADSDADADDAADKPDEVTKLRDELRKHRGTERRSKKAETRVKELEAELKKVADKDKSEQEKALEKAREEAKNEVLSEVEKERRSTRLEVVITRLASKGVKVGEGDDAKTVRFADPEDAQVFIERAISREEIDAEDIYDDKGKVNTDALTSELVELLERKPNLASDDKPAPKAKGSADGGKGTNTSTDLDDLNPDELYKRVRNRD